MEGTGTTGVRSVASLGPLNTRYSPLAGLTVKCTRWMIDIICHSML